MGLRLSVIIPVLNEAKELPALLRSLRPLDGDTEILFVDGGSRDGSPALVRAAGYPLLTSAPGRARQMNAGARAARGDVFLFLHADTRLPPDGVHAVRAAMRDPAVVAGRFDLVYEVSAWPYRWIAWMGSLRSRVAKVLTGDHGMFIRRQAFCEVGGCPDVPLMEDVEISRRLKRLGRVACLRARVVGSTRKYRREGVWRTIRLMWLLRTLHALGVSAASPHRIPSRPLQVAPSRRAGLETEVPSLRLGMALAPPSGARLDQRARRRCVERRRRIADDGELLGASERFAQRVTERPRHEHRPRQPQPERRIAQSRDGHGRDAARLERALDQSDGLVAESSRGLVVLQVDTSGCDECGAARTERFRERGPRGVGGDAGACPAGPEPPEDRQACERAAQETPPARLRLTCVIVTVLWRRGAPRLSGSVRGRTARAPRSPPASTRAPAP